MSTIADTKLRYGYGSILLHWIVAALGLTLIWTGYDFMVLPRGPEKGAALAAHLAIGWITILAIVARVGWRLANPLPALTGPTWQRHAARTAHWALLILIVGLAATGFVAIVTGRSPANVLGLFSIPNFLGQGGPLHSGSEEIHSWASHIFVAILALHVAAALKRSFVDKDGTLRRMLKVD